MLYGISNSVDNELIDLYFLSLYTTSILLDLTGVFNAVSISHPKTKRVCNNSISTSKVRASSAIEGYTTPLYSVLLAIDLTGFLTASSNVQPALSRDATTLSLILNSLAISRMVEYSFP